MNKQNFDISKATNGGEAAPCGADEVATDASTVIDILKPKDDQLFGTDEDYLSSDEEPVITTNGKSSKKLC